MPKKILDQNGCKCNVCVNGDQARHAWMMSTVPLPIAIIFNKLQGWRNDETTQKNCSNQGTNKDTGLQQSSANRVYDYRYITPEESKMLAKDFPTCIDPSLITMKVHKVPGTNDAQQKEQKAAQKQTQEKSKNDKTQANNKANKKTRKGRKSLTRKGTYVPTGTCLNKSIGSNNDNDSNGSGGIESI